MGIAIGPGAGRNAEVSQSNRPNHTRDEDCTVDPADDCCIECGVYHGDPCPACDGRGFHREACPDLCPVCGGVCEGYEPHPDPRAMRRAAFAAHDVLHRAMERAFLALPEEVREDESVSRRFYDALEAIDLALDRALSRIPL